MTAASAGIFFWGKAAAPVAVMKSMIAMMAEKYVRPKPFLVLVMTKEEKRNQLCT